MIREPEGLRFAPIGKQDFGDVLMLRHIDAYDQFSIIDAFGFW